MTTKVQKWGNSLAIRIPKEFANSIDLKEGSFISLSLKGQVIAIKNHKKPVYKLSDLLKGYKKTKENREFDFGKPIGREIW